MAIVSLTSQDTAMTQAPRYRAPNAVFVEALGNGGLYSFNYDRRLNNSVSIRAGLTKWTSVALLGDQPTRHYKFQLLMRSEEHTSELQSRFDLVCRLLLEKKNRTIFAHCVETKKKANND